jgi:hypothetical protein
MNDRKSRKLTEEEIEARKSPHPSYNAFVHLKGGLVSLARQIVKESGSNAPDDVRRFVEQFGQKTC